MNQKNSAPLTINAVSNTTIRVRPHVRAFTLIELLVVIVIIGILAAISVAQYNGYQDRARDAKVQAEARDACTVSVAACIVTGSSTCQSMSACMAALSGSSEPAPFATFVASVPDADFRAAIVTRLRKTESSITEADLNGITGHLDIRGRESFDSTGMPPWMIPPSEEQRRASNISDLTGIGYFTGITSIRFHDNSLTTIPSEIGNLTQLTSLQGHNNQITTIPGTIGNLTSLTQLLLHDNEIASLPDSITNLISVTGFWLHNNNLSSLPVGMGNLTAINQLLLSGNNTFASFPVVPDGQTIDLDALTLQDTGVSCNQAEADGWNADRCFE